MAAAVLLRRGVAAEQALLRVARSSLFSPAARSHRCNAPAVTTRGFFDLNKSGNKDAIQKDKARLNDELSRGYFADISEIRKNDGKIAQAHKSIIPSVSASQFPDLEISYPDGCTKMAESWSIPFLDKFAAANNKMQIYEISFIDSWLFSKGPAKRLFLKILKKSNVPQRQVVYAFGDHYDFRKKLHIVNLLTAYVFLLDRFGKIRWQGFGHAAEDELSTLFSCTSMLLDGE